MKLTYPPGATPLDPDETAGLLPASISTQAELDAFEQANILDGERWPAAAAVPHRCAAIHPAAADLHRSSTPPVAGSIYM